MSDWNRLNIRDDVRNWTQAKLFGPVNTKLFFKDIPQIVSFSGIYDIGLPVSYVVNRMIWRQRVSRIFK